MPFKSLKQSAFMHSKHPDIAKRWDKETPDFSNLPRYAHKGIDGMSQADGKEDSLGMDGFEQTAHRKAMDHMVGALSDLATQDRKSRLMKLMASKKPINKLESSSEQPAPTQDSNHRMDILSKMKAIEEDRKKGKK